MCVIFCIHDSSVLTGYSLILQSLLCKYAFPDCTLNDGNAVGLPICQEDCVALKSHYCFNDWATIEDNKRRGILVASRGHFRLPKCEKLPKYDNATKVCTKSSVTSMRYELSTSKCSPIQLSNFLLVLSYLFVFCCSDVLWKDCLNYPPFYGK